MNEIFEGIKIITEKGKSCLGKDITIWGWHFSYKGKKYFSFIGNHMYKYNSYCPIPTILKEDMTAERQIGLFSEMINCMKEVKK